VLKVPRRVHPTGFKRLQRHQLSEATRLSRGTALIAGMDTTATATATAIANTTDKTISFSSSIYLLRRYSKTVE